MSRRQSKIAIFERKTNATAREMSRQMFLRFGWDADSALLSDYQRELTER